MISGVFCILLGEGVLFGSKSLLIWFAVFAIGNLIYMPLFEEPGLERRFGEDYVRYKKHVPRWIPRRTPWEASSGSER
jgi:protein-S-isoprenylcysteine O-methyltransferase Ste14